MSPIKRKPAVRRGRPARPRPPAVARQSPLSLALTEAAKALTSSLQRSQVLESLMRHVAGLLGPENWSLLLLDRERQELYFEIVVGQAADAIRHMRLPLSEGIAGWVVRHKQPLVIPKVADDPRFCPRMDEASSFRTASVLAVPLIFADEVLGVLELVAQANQRPFVDQDLAALIPFADFCAIAIHNARTYERIEELTITDEWTRLHNARYMRGCLADEVERADRYHHPVSVAFIDLDHFKQVNDTRGHSVGSLVLREVGEVLLSRVRNTDRAVRYGGDEFVIVMPETDKAGAVALGDRVRRAVAERAFSERDGTTVRITASVGIATYPDDARDAVALLGAADRAMYAAKAQGRNRTVAAEEIAPPPGAGG